MKITNNFKKNLFVFLLVSFVIVAPVVLFAQIETGTGNQGNLGGTGQTGNLGGGESARVVNPINTNTVDEFIKVVLVGVIKIGIPIIVLALVYCGFLFVSARGNSEKISKAKDALLYTIIGAAVLLGSWAIAELISSTVLQL